MKHRPIYYSISRLAISLLLTMVMCGTAHAQSKMFRLEKDSIPLFRGFALSFDLVGPAMLLLSDHGEYEGALRVNLHDQWFPIFELGLGKANHKTDEITKLSYKTTAPYFRIGMDWNILKNKHQANRMYAGFRYAFTSYKSDIAYEMREDEYWKSSEGYDLKGISNSQHWLEIVLGIDAKVAGPFHLGWTARYKRRLHHSDTPYGQSWYVPGFGIYDKDQLTANFNVIIDI